MSDLYLIEDDDKMPEEVTLNNFESVVSPSNGRTYQRIPHTRPKGVVATENQISNMWLFFDYWEAEECDICGWGYNVFEINGERICNNCFQKLVDEYKISSCCKCEEILRVEDLIPYNGYYYCKDCYEKLFDVCPICGEKHLKSNMLVTDDNTYVCRTCAQTMPRCSICGKLIINGSPHNNMCSVCYNELYFTCSICGKEESTGNKIYAPNTNQPICKHCAEERYYYCSICKTFTDKPLTDGVCESCWEKYVWKGRPRLYHYHGRDSPWNYHADGEDSITFKPKEGVRYLGAEIELNGNEYVDDMSDILYDAHSILNEIVHYERDGSLSKCGFEIITEPMTLIAHMSYKERYQRFFSWADSTGLFNNDDAGLHIHVTSSFLMGPKIRRLLYILLIHRGRMTKFARRCGGHYCSYATLKTVENRIGMKFDKNDFDSVVRFMKGYQRYLGNSPGNGSSNHGIYLNIGGRSNYDDPIKSTSTVEFRLYKGTLSYLEFMATLQMTDVLVEYVNNHTLEQIINAPFEEIVFSKYPELNYYLVQCKALPRKKINEEAFQEYVNDSSSGNIPEIYEDINNDDDDCIEYDDSFDDHEDGDWDEDDE